MHPTCFTQRQSVNLEAMTRECKSLRVEGKHKHYAILEAVLFISHLALHVPAFLLLSICVVHTDVMEKYC
ncbi:hypothetical protein BDV25DRAFT_158763 [Aspergillus avenaceus]|uniref:Uncharacterized protein n=1 Tax=Aspergillus avenaceus TaxID=36643 RepID=A0A5N6TQ33_ASPAV|nr:hypothetical protein BDV25DRAFT_158763 [Aspergillus avenaceus]